MNHLDVTPPPPPRKKDPKARAIALLSGLDRLYPDADCELNWHNPYELLVAVILSAQCTDKMVNQVTPALFRRYPDPASLAGADMAELQEMIRSTGFFRMKAAHIKETSRRIMQDHGGQVPRTLEELVQLPGVARKTANVVMGTAFGVPSGVVVDTHIKRLSRRLGLTRHEDPQKIEGDLMKKWPQDRWIKSGHQLIWHGRRVCDARRPRCGECTLSPLCPQVGVPAAIRETSKQGAK